MQLRSDTVAGIRLVVANYCGHVIEVTIGNGGNDHFVTIIDVEILCRSDQGNVGANEAATEKERLVSIAFQELDCRLCRHAVGMLQVAG